MTRMDQARERAALNRAVWADPPVAALPPPDPAGGVQDHPADPTRKET